MKKEYTKPYGKQLKQCLQENLYLVYAYIKKEENQNLITQHYTLRNLKQQGKLYPEQTEERK